MDDSNVTILYLYKISVVTAFTTIEVQCIQYFKLKMHGDGHILNFGPNICIAYIASWLLLRHVV